MLECVYEGEEQISNLIWKGGACVSAQCQGTLPWKSDIQTEAFSLRRSCTGKELGKAKMDSMCKGPEAEGAAFS